MIEIRINKDVGDYEAKFIGPFTMRQTLCLLVTAPVCWAIYFGLSPFIGQSLAGFIVFIPAGICWAIGWYKPYGMHTEKFIRSVFVSSFLAPVHRKYRTVNRHEQALKTILAANAVPSNKKQKQKKYKVSPLAVR